MAVIIAIAVSIAGFGLMMWCMHMMFEPWRQDINERIAEHNERIARQSNASRQTDEV